MGDLRILDIAADLGGKYFAQFDYKWYTDDFREMIKQEMDFRIEANNCKKCGEMFKDSKNVVVPKVFDEYSTPRTLVMSFEEGMSVGKVKEMHSKGIPLKDVSKIISEAFNYMIYEKGFVHGDPHPGNMMARVNKDGELQIVILDHGVYTTLEEKTRIAYTKLWRGILIQDE